MTDSEKLDEILRILRAGHSAPAGNGEGGKVADDKTFQGQYGNPEATIDPKAWDGASMKGRRFSECDPAWLDLAADMYDAFGVKAKADNKLDKNGKPVAWRDHQRSALCRRWAIELRKQGIKPKPPTDLFDTEDAPF